MKTLLVDNYDSFTFNLYQLCAEVSGREPVVIRNDTPWEELRRLDFDNVVLSPGPGRPERAEDFGVCTRLLAEAAVPVPPSATLDVRVAPVFTGVEPGSSAGSRARRRRRSSSNSTPRAR